MSDPLDDAFETKDGKLYLQQVEVPGHPGFSMFAAAKESVSEDAEREYRDGYFRAVAFLLEAITQGGKFDRGYQHALVDIGRLMKAKGRLDARDLEPWVKGSGSQWIEEVRTDLRVLPPALGRQD